MPQLANVTFTDAAVNKVRELLEEEQNPKLKLHIAINGGGCSGMQYAFSFDESVNEDDWVLEKNGVQLVINAISYMYLEGAEIDYSNSITGEQFTIRNPHAQTTCGCGSSFTVAEEPSTEESV